MASSISRKSGHTGQTDAGHTRDVKVERIGKVTIYKRGGTYFLYYRENKQSKRDRVEGNLAAARATASDIQAALAKGLRSPLGFDRTSPTQLTERFLDIF